VRAACVQRYGRYPNLKDHGVGCTVKGLFGDYNMPPKNHWIVQDYIQKKSVDFDGETNSEVFEIPAPYYRKEGYHAGKHHFYHNGYTYIPNPRDECSHLHDIENDVGEVVTPGLHYYHRVRQEVSLRPHRGLCDWPLTGGTTQPV